jgi:hypothetical protein
MMAWIIAGAAGAGLVYRLYPWPAPGMHVRNVIWLFGTAAVGFIAWLLGAVSAWSFPAAWYATFILLQLSQHWVGPGRYVWLRVVASATLVVFMAWLLVGNFVW